MRITTLMALVLCGLAGAASTASAQPVDDQSTARLVELSDVRMRELDEWTHKVADWQKKADLWIDEGRGSWAKFLERHHKPEPPAWLHDACDFTSTDDQRLTRACDMLARWNDDPFTTRTRRAATATIQQKEKSANSVWWRHVHFDGLWSTTRSDVAALGLFGAHLTVDVEGRLQVFVAPGILLVRVPTPEGSQDVSPATDWGVTYRLFSAGQTTVHFNLVHAWMLGNRANLLYSNMTLAGFSLTFRPRPH